MHAVVRAFAGVLALVVVATAGDAVAADAPVPAVSAVPVSPAAEPSAPGAAGDVVILHTDSSSAAGSLRLREALDDLGATVRHRFGAQQAVSVALPADPDPSVAYAQLQRLQQLPGVVHVEAPVTRTLAADPDDPKLAEQRSYLDAVRARPAWARQSGSAAVRIAVVDTGVDVGHPDLKGKVVGSYNALTRSGNVTDTVGHGTFVAGVAAARTGNAVGIAGAGYRSSILAVKVADRYGDIALDDEIAGIRWAADHGAGIINLSLSGPDPSSSELAAVRYAQAKGALVVAAAGNDGNSTKQYPAAYPGVVAVAATDVARTRRAAFSSHGPWVTLAAPGVNLLSTSPGAGSDYFPKKSGYARGDGTSFAAPLVAGAAALLKAQNPAMTWQQVRAALVASAHGYAGSDVGRGQLDIDLALRHVTPTGTPVLPAAAGTSGTVSLTARSTAPTVSFRVDGEAWLPPVAATGGVARRAFTTYGYTDGSHTVSARNCSEFGECNAAAVSSTFVVGNGAPTLTTPTTGDRLSGRFTATGTSPGGGLRLLVDGRQVGFDGAADPDGRYTFTVNGSLVADGGHQLVVQTCTATGSRCDGTRSVPAPVQFDSLHPAVTRLDRAAFSPNGDRVADTVTATYSLDAPTQRVVVEVRDASGVLRRSADLAEQGAGAHAWRWDGRDDTGVRVPDGRYRVAIVTSRTDAAGTSGTSGTRHGLAERDVQVDTVAPRLGGATGAGTTFFPVHDGYRDLFSPTVALPDGGVLRLVVRNARGGVVRVLQASRPASRTGLTWNGRTAAGRLAAAGSYRWHFEATDAAGNVRRTPEYRVGVSAKRLVTRAVTLTRRAATTSAAGSARCAGKTRSTFRGGVHLVNRCPGKRGEVAYAEYAFTVPAALRYHRLQLSAYGRSARASQLTATFQRTDGGLELPRGKRIGRSKSRWRALPSVPAAAHLAGRRVRVALVLSGRYAGTNDFDARSVRLRVTLTRLV